MSVRETVVKNPLTLASFTPGTDHAQTELVNLKDRLSQSAPEHAVLSGYLLRETSKKVWKVHEFHSTDRVCRPQRAVPIYRSASSNSMEPTSLIDTTPRVCSRHSA